MRLNIRQIATFLVPGGRAHYVVGDSGTNAGGRWTAIETCRHICDIAEAEGLRARRLVEISITTENYKHIKNAITENAVLEFHKAA